jgi:hypothetical protein
VAELLNTFMGRFSEVLWFGSFTGKSPAPLGESEAGTW